MKKAVFIPMVLAVLMFVACGTDEKTKVSETNNEVQLADNGLIHKIIDKSALENELSDEQVATIFETYHDKESITVDDKKIDSNHQKHENRIERENGSEGKTYPYAFYRPVNSECGKDSDDIIALYNVPWGSTTPQDNIKYYSNPTVFSWFLNLVHPGGLSANGFDTNKIRVCIGSRGQLLLGSDLSKIYLWHK
jgi:hypothetical protein